ncbi:MAG: DUF3558 family protein [Kibdelosporangium sp.]
MKARGVTTLLIALLLVGCSSSTQGQPRGASSSSGNSKVDIGKTKQVGEELACDTVAPASLVTAAIGTPAVVDPKQYRACDFDLPTPGRSTAGRAHIAVSTVPLVGENSDLDGNTLVTDRRGDDKECDMALAVAPRKFLRVSLLMFNDDRGDVCERSKTLLKSVFDGLPE